MKSFYDAIKVDFKLIIVPDGRQTGYCLTFKIPITAEEHP
jgi:hypothetical protein